MAFETEAVATIAAGAAVLSCLAFLRRFLPAKVNCHFCCQNFRIPYELRNSWTCPSCKQYNGFDKDGGYNRDFQRFAGDPNLRFCETQKRPSSKSPNNGLCETCNLNQDLKVESLRSFKPKNPSKYDEEIKEHEAYLEKIYRLCRYCKQPRTYIQKLQLYFSKKVNFTLVSQADHAARVANKNIVTNR